MFRDLSVERSVRGGDAALCQITLNTCSDRNYEDNLNVPWAVVPISAPVCSFGRFALL